jgi:hypothetical protein
MELSGPPVLQLDEQVRIGGGLALPPAAQEVLRAQQTGAHPFLAATGRRVLTGMLSLPACYVCAKHSWISVAARPSDLDHSAPSYVPGCRTTMFRSEHGASHARRLSCPAPQLCRARAGPGAHRSAPAPCCHAPLRRRARVLAGGTGRLVRSIMTRRAILGTGRRADRERRVCLWLRCQHASIWLRHHSTEILHRARAVCTEQRRRPPWRRA